MIETMKFIADHGGSIFQESKPAGPKSNIIRDYELKDRKPVKIDHKVKTASHEHGGKIMPITENGEITGVYFECSCGETARFYFEYEK